MVTNDWVLVTTEELATLVEALDRALAASLRADNKVWLKVEGASVVFQVDPVVVEDPTTTKRLAAARAAWKELTTLLATAE